MIDAYDVLGVGLDADTEEIKKAYKRLSLQYHPDKVQATGSKDANEKFHEIKAAVDILQDADRRKMYDTFGVDLGEERPEMEVWSIGLSALLSPLGSFTVKTFLVRFVIWIVGFKWIGYLLLLAGLVVAVMYWRNFQYGEFRLRQEGLPIVINTAIACAIVVVCWIWRLLADTLCNIYLVSEVVDVSLLLDSWKIGLGVAVASFFFAWLLRNWWLWILGLEVAAAIVLLIALTVSCGLMGLWVENAKNQHGEKLKEWRLRMRKERKALQDEIADLKRRLQDHESNGSSALAGDSGRRPGR